MKIVTVLKPNTGYPEEPNGNPAVEFQGKLFPDKVTWYLCMLRRQEHNLKGGFICEGCFIDRIMSM
jgi:hypothetical protein